MKSSCLIVPVCTAALLAFAPAADAHPVGMLRVKEVVPTLEKEIAAQPQDPALAYQLGRIHQIAAESGSDVIYDAYRNNPGPGVHFATHNGGAFDEAQGGEPTLDPEDRRAHLLAAITAYRTSLALAPKGTLELALTHLRLATALEKAGTLAVDWSIAPPTTQPAPSPAELRQIEQEVQHLGSDSATTRATANNALRQHLLAALPALEARRNDADAEIRSRVATLLDFAPRKAWYEQAANECRAILAMLQAPRPDGPDSDNLILKGNTEASGFAGQLRDDAALCVYEAAEGLVRLLDATALPATENERDQTQALADLLAKQFKVKPDPIDDDEVW